VIGLNGIERSASWYYAVMASAVYFGMLVLPSFKLGIFQIFLFLVACYFHFSDGFTTAMLQKAYNKQINKDT
jgi:hypothetical protein